MVEQDNSIILGSVNGKNSATSDALVGIGTTQPASKLHIANGNLYLSNTGSAGEIRLQEPNAQGTHYAAFRAQAQSESITYELPSSTGTIGQHLTIQNVASGTVTLGWATPSDRNRKENILTLDGENILQQFRTFSLGSWNYKGEDVRHYGIMAQDFFRAFGQDALGNIGSDTVVNPTDLHGISFLAIQGLEKRTQALLQTLELSQKRVSDLENSLSTTTQRLHETQQTIQTLEKNNRTLEQRLARLENLLEQQRNKDALDTQEHQHDNVTEEK
jgi:hypothetical protein